MSYVRVTFTQNITGQILQNVVHFLNPDGLQTHQQIKDELLANWITPMRTHQVNTCFWTNIEVRDMTGPTPAVTQFALGQLAGAFTGTGQHICIGYCLQLRSGLVGRHNRGRIYMPGSRGDYTTNNQLNTTGVTNLTTWATGVKGRYVGPGQASPLSLVIWHKDSPGRTPTIVTDIQPRTTLGVQRRRNIGTGI